MGFLYFDIKHAIDEHDHIIEVSGGLMGIRDQSLLESVFAHVRNDDYYPNLKDKLTHIVFSIAMNHAFIDGNKRSSIALGAYFLEINGWDGVIGKFIVEMENIVLWVAEGKISKDFLLEIIDDILEKGFLSEEAKLKIIKIIGCGTYPEVSS
jgi:death-on-curing protein